MTDALNATKAAVEEGIVPGTILKLAVEFSGGNMCQYPSQKF